MVPAPVRILLMLCSFLITLPLSSNALASTHFPLYDVIAPNVEFWTKIYTEYTNSQAVIHDSTNLDIIYAVVDLMPYEESGARKINRRRMKLARKKYEKILRHLAAEPAAADAESRRVAALFGPQSTAKTFRKASANVRSQVGQSDRFKAGLIRSGAYIDQIRTIIKSYGLPEELAFLPHVESSFSTTAYSKFGAAGLWQFTRSTGKLFMKVGYVLDERRDPILATHAAANLLKENYMKLGSWPLAITAYNHGAAGMERAKKSFGDYTAIFKHYHGRTFKFASRNFYSEFLAAYRVASNYQDFFGELQLDRPARFQAVPLDGYAEFKRLCDYFNVETEVARSLNPALRSPVFNGQKLVPKGYPFRLPSGLELASIPSDLFKRHQKPSHFYTVQGGDTAGRIARIHNVKLADLVLANNLDHKARIYPRQTLRIPLPGQALSAAKPEPAAKPVEPAVLAGNDDLTPADTTSPQEDKTYPKPVLASIIPTSIPGVLSKPEPDTYATDGQPPSVEIVSADVRFEKVISHAGRPVGVLQVEVEETLGHYAEWSGARTQQIRLLNGLRFGQTLHLHQKIKIPLSRTTAGEFEENRYEFHKRLQEDFFAVYQIGDLQPYRVRYGDNLWTLCLEKFDIPMWLLKNCNPEVDFAQLRLHQKLMVPGIEKNTADDATDPPGELESEEDNVSAKI